MDLIKHFYHQLILLIQQRNTSEDNRKMNFFKRKSSRHHHDENHQIHHHKKSFRNEKITCKSIAKLIEGLKVSLSNLHNNNLDNNNLDISNSDNKLDKSNLNNNNLVKNKSNKNPDIKLLLESLKMYLFTLLNEQQQQKYDEVMLNELLNQLFQANLLHDLITSIPLMEFECQKIVTIIFRNLLLAKIDNHLVTIELLSHEPKILFILMESYQQGRSDVTLNCGQILRICLQHEQLAKLILNSDQFYKVKRLEIKCPHAIITYYHHDLPLIF